MEPDVLNDGQVTADNEEIRSGVEQALAADAAKQSAPPPPPEGGNATTPSFGQAILDATNTAIQYLGKSNPELVDLARSRADKDGIAKEMKSRAFAGVGATDLMPKPDHVAILRQQQGNPEAISAFEWKYGAGSAQRYLRAPSDAHIDKLFANKDNPEAIEAFNAAYGGLAPFYVVLKDPKSSQVDKEIASYRILQALKTGQVDSSGAGLADAVRSGYRKAVGETIRSVTSGVDLATGGDASSQIVVPDNTAPKSSPILYDIVEGVSQFATGRVALGAVTGGAGNLGNAARFFREIALSGAVDAFAFNPEDKLLTEKLAQAVGLNSNWTKDGLDEDWKRRLARTAEGAVIGTALEGIFLAVRAYRARGAGNADEAARLQAESKAKIEEAAKAAEAAPEGKVAQATPAAPIEPRQLELPLEQRPYARSGQGELFDAQTLRQADNAAPAPSPVRHTEAELSVRTGDQVVDDILKNKGPAQRALDEATGSVADGVPASVRQILDNTPSFDNFSAQALREATAPLLDDFLGVARNSAEDMDRIISRNISIDDATKLQAYLTQASARATELAGKLKSDLDVAMSRIVTNVDEIDGIKAQIKEVNDYIANIQKAYDPLGTISGRLMQMRQMEGAIATAFKGDVDALRSSGMTDVQINSMIADSVQAADKSRLDKLIAQRKVAIAQNDLTKADNIAAEIEKEAARVQKAAERLVGVKLGKARSMAEQIGRDLQQGVMKSLLSGFGTPIRGVLGTAAMRNLWDKPSLFVGAIRSYGLSNGVSFYKHLAESRSLGIQSGFETASKAYLKMLRDAAVDSWKNNPKSSVTGYDGSAKVRNLEASNYLDEGAARKGLDAGFYVIDKLDMPLRFTDEFISNIYNRAGVGEAAGYRFFSNRMDQLNEINARLRDPNLTDAAKASLKADLKRIKKGNTEIKLEDGSWISLKDFIKKEMDSSFDETGRFINEAVTERTDYLMLKAEFTSNVAKSIERGLNTPAAIPLRLLSLPFIRNPINGFKVYTESIPGLRRLTSDYAAQLASPDPLVRMRAEGKALLGWAVQGAAFLSAYYGYSTYMNVRDRKTRESDAASSSVGNASIDFGGFGVPMTGMDPLSGHFVLPPAIVNTVLNRHYHIQDKQRRLEGEAATGKTVEPLSNMELLLSYAGAMMVGSSLGVGSLLIEQPSLTSMRDMVDLVASMTKTPKEGDEPDVDRALGNLLKSQVGMINPAIVRGVRNSFDPNTYDIKTLSDALTYQFFGRDALPLRYDALGFPIESKNPYRGLTGPLFPVYNRNIGTKEQYVRDSLNRLGDMTGSYTVFNGTPPDELLRKYGVDLTQIKSAVGERRVSDEFAKELSKVKPGGLPTLTDRLFNIFANEAKLAERGLSTGSYKFDGTKVELISKIIRQHRDAAWQIVLAREEANYNEELLKTLRRARAEQATSKNPRYDTPNPRSLQPVFPTQ